jgi:drug/metabolite transporter (DMT)-like permease
LWIDTPWRLSSPSSIAVLALIALGVLSTALAYVLFFKLIARAGATNAVLVTLLVPVSAMVLGVMLLDEVISMHQLIGMALISVGLAAIDGRLLQRLGFKHAQKLKV